MSEVRSAYLEWLAAYESRKILSESAGDARQLREMLEGRVAEGTRPGAELSAARFEEARAALELSHAEAKLTAARLALELVLGQALPADAEPDPKLLTKAPAQQTSSEAARARALHLQSQAASALALSHRRAKAPMLAASVEAGLRGQSAELFPAYRVGLALSVPFFDGGFSSASASLAEAEAAELSALAREARGGIAAEAARARAELLSGEEQLRLAQVMLAAAEDELRHARDQQELANAPAEAVVQARQRVARAKLEVLGARVTRARAELHLAGAPSNLRQPEPRTSKR